VQANNSHGTNGLTVGVSIETFHRSSDHPTCSYLLSTCPNHNFVYGVLGTMMVQQMMLMVVDGALLSFVVSMRLLSAMDSQQITSALGTQHGHSLWLDW
jgi:hypothetical protein